MIYVLETIKEAIENITKDIKLEKPPLSNAEFRATSNIMDYELTSPAVYVGWYPNEGLEEYQGLAPSITVMMDNGDDIDGEDISNIKIRLGIMIYDPGTTTEEEVKLNAKGYKDLLNLIFLIKKDIKSELSLNISKIKWELPQEQKFPYWFGFINFELQIKNITKKSKEVLENL